MTAARTSIAITRSNDARREEIRRILDRWDLLLEQTAAIEARLAELVAQHPGASTHTTWRPSDDMIASRYAGAAGDALLEMTKETRETARVRGDPKDALRSSN